MTNCLPERIQCPFCLSYKTEYETVHNGVCEIKAGPAVCLDCESFEIWWEEIPKLIKTEQIDKEEATLNWQRGEQYVVTERRECKNCKGKFAVPTRKSIRDRCITCLERFIREVDFETAKTKTPVENCKDRDPRVFCVLCESGGHEPEPEPEQYCIYCRKAKSREGSIHGRWVCESNENLFLFCEYPGTLPKPGEDR